MGQIKILKQEDRLRRLLSRIITKRPYLSLATTSWWSGSRFLEK